MIYHTKKEALKLKTLQILANNSRTTTKQLAKEIKTSQQSASYIISQLKDKKYIKSFNLIADSSKFGYNNFCVFLRLKILSKTSINTLIKELKKYNEITCIDILFGNFDLFLKFTTPNTSYFNKILQEILTKYKNNFTSHKILTQIVLHYYPSNYLTVSNINKDIIISGDRKYTTITSTDKQIINILNDNSRTSSLEIAKELNTTAKTIISRRKNLEKLKIIKQYSININHKKLRL